MVMKEGEEYKMVRVNNWWKSSWSNRREEDFLNNILHRKVNLIGHIVTRVCLLHNTIEGQMTEVKRVEIPAVYGAMSCD